MNESRWELSEDVVAMLEHVRPDFRLDEKKMLAFIRAAGCAECWRFTREMSNVRAAEYIAMHCIFRRSHIKAAILRDIFGNPFRPVSLCGATVETTEPSFTCVACQRILTPDVRSVAQAAYDSVRENGTLDPVRLAVLADALEEAGCTEKAILEHLRRSCCVCNGKGTIKVPYGEPSQGHDVEPCPYCFDINHVPGCWALDLILGKE
jgi:hypothetical protein